MKKFSVFWAAPLAAALAFCFILASCASSAKAVGETSGEISFPGTTWTWKSGGQSRDIRFYGSTYSYHFNGQREAYLEGDFWLEGDKLWITYKWIREGDLLDPEYFLIVGNTIQDISHQPPRVYKQKK
jgi:hypothetical protein